MQSLSAVLIASLLGAMLLVQSSPALAQHTLEHAPQSITDEGPPDHVLYLPTDVRWQDGPGSLEPGARFAVLEGDPSEPGVFTLRIHMPDGYYISPHSHPKPERLTVISGNFLLGMGEEMVRDNVTRLVEGTYTAMPPGMTHYAFTEGETVIQLTSTGPWQINYVNEEDDPRLR